MAPPRLHKLSFTQPQNTRSGAMFKPTAHYANAGMQRGIKSIGDALQAYGQRQRQEKMQQQQVAAVQAMLGGQQPGSMPGPSADPYPTAGKAPIAGVSQPERLADIPPNTVSPGGYFPASPEVDPYATAGSAPIAQVTQQALGPDHALQVLGDILEGRRPQQAGMQVEPRAPAPQPQGGGIFGISPERSRQGAIEATAGAAAPLALGDQDREPGDWIRVAGDDRAAATSYSPGGSEYQAGSMGVEQRRAPGMLGTPAPQATGIWRRTQAQRQAMSAALKADPSLAPFIQRQLLEGALAPLPKRQMQSKFKGGLEQKGYWDRSGLWVDVGGTKAAAAPRAPRTRQFSLPNGQIQNQEVHEGKWRNVGAPFDRRDNLIIVDEEDNLGNINRVARNRQDVEADLAGGKGTVLGSKQRKFTDYEKKAAGWTARMKEAEGTLTKLYAENPDFNPANLTDSYLLETPIIGNALISAEYQQYVQAAKAWINGFMRAESGSAIPPPEMQSNFEIYFPQAWDGPKVIAQKRKFRKVAEGAMQSAAGAAYTNLLQSQQEKATLDQRLDAVAAELKKALDALGSEK